jgi:hypothetical protein
MAVASLTPSQGAAGTGGRNLGGVSGDSGHQPDLRPRTGGAAKGMPRNWKYSGPLRALPALPRRAPWAGRCTRGEAGSLDRPHTPWAGGRQGGGRSAHPDSVNILLDSLDGRLLAAPGGPQQEDEGGGHSAPHASAHGSGHCGRTSPPNTFTGRRSSR